MTLLTFSSILQSIRHGKPHNSLRRLQQLEGIVGAGETSSKGPSEVSSASEFVTAVASGAQDIRIIDHMDLTGLPGFSVLEQSLPTFNLRSVRVRISHSPVAAPYVSLRSLSSSVVHATFTVLYYQSLTTTLGFSC